MQTVKMLKLLNSLLPNDPGVLARLGAIHARFDDEAGALHFYQVRGPLAVLPGVQKWQPVHCRTVLALALQASSMPCRCRCH
jgi:hypothetical protein